MHWHVLFKVLPPIATVIAAIVIACAGYRIQQRIHDNAMGHQWFQASINLLQQRDLPTKAMNGWAVDLLKKYVPKNHPIPPEVEAGLRSGDLILGPSRVPTAPSAEWRKLHSNYQRDLQGRLFKAVYGELPMGDLTVQIGRTYGEVSIATRPCEIGPNGEFVRTRDIPDKSFWIRPMVDWEQITDDASFDHLVDGIANQLRWEFKIRGFWPKEDA